MMLSKPKYLTSNMLRFPAFRLQNLERKSTTIFQVSFLGLFLIHCLEMRLIVDGCTILINKVLILSINHLFVTLGSAFVLGFFFRL